MAAINSPMTLIGGGSGGKMLFGVTLPPSIYYTQAAEWLKIKDNPKTAVAETQWDGQVVCGGNLWELCGNNAYCYSLETGDLLETVPLTGAGNYCGSAIATDGKSRIWFARTSYYAADTGNNATIYAYLYLYEFDVQSKSVKSLYTSPALSAGSHYMNGYSQSNLRITNTSISRIGIIGYSKTSNTVYLGKVYQSSTTSYQYYTSSSGDSPTKSSSSASGGNNSMFAYDLLSNTCTQIANYPYNDANRGQYFYDEGDFFYVGNGFNGADKDKRISRYNKQSNIWENISTTFEGYAVGPFSYVQIGDKMLQISKDATGIFDPKTGNLETLSVPVIPPDATIMYPGFKAFSNNILYLVTSQGVYKCPFFSRVPEDAPIVCKIYKGQKYHTTEPFEIPGKLKLLRTQQVADRDIEIKMYEYDSAGGQTIYIET